MKLSRDPEKAMALNSAPVALRARLHWGVFVVWAIYCLGFLAWHDATSDGLTRGSYCTTKPVKST